MARFLPTLLLCTLLAPAGVSPADAQVNILPLGDSITQGEHRGNTSFNSYRRLLWQQLRDAGYAINFVGSLTNNFPAQPPNPDFDLDHEGHWGWRADEILRGRSGTDATGSGRLSTWLQHYTPDVVLMHLGTNDAFQNNPTAETVAELEQIIDTIRADNPRVVILLARLIPANGAEENARIQALNAEMDAISARKSQPQSRILVVDQYAGFNAAADTYDGVHPNENGEHKMAGRWFEALAPVLDTLTVQPVNHLQENPSPTPGILHPIHPSPIHRHGTVTFTLPEPQPVRVSLYTLQGRRVRLLYDGTPPAGRPHSVPIDGRGLSSGVYLVHVRGQSVSDTRPVAVAR